LTTSPGFRPMLTVPADTPVTGQLADVPTRGLNISWTGQLVD